MASACMWVIFAAIIDPGSYAKPFTVQTRARFEPTWELMEYICQENNTNVGHITQ